ncbi:uncharacterized protein LOC144097497 [Amblyomma americanum]|uniref:C2H2-type domain-containing protein n=1 Tax=Amblyomma americanum TaxID=6943 RepID=A0AAQ4EC09_AMBAM
MDRNTVVSLLTVGLADLEERRWSSTESADSDTSSEACPEITEQRRRLRAIRPAGADTVHYCRECQLLFRDPSKLVAHHVYKHQFESTERGRKLPCPICQQSCRSRNTMAAHLGTHLGERACRKCGAEFASACAVSAHKLFHRTGGDFSCGLCGMAFARQSSLTAHSRTQHAQRV